MRALWEKLASGILTNHKGKLYGTVLGLLVPLMIMRFGLPWTIFILASTYVGYRIGKRIDESQESLEENLAEIIDRYLPPSDR